MHLTIAGRYHSSRGSFIQKQEGEGFQSKWSKDLNETQSFTAVRVNICFWRRFMWWEFHVLCGESLVMFHVFCADSLWCSMFSVLRVLWCSMFSVLRVLWCSLFSVLRVLWCFMSQVHSSRAETQHSGRVPEEGGQVPGTEEKRLGRCKQFCNVGISPIQALWTG